MRVFLSADMEGVTGVCHGDHLMASGHDYERARRWLTQDVNAAIEGAIAGGATEVVVADGHATMRNILIDELHEAARLVCGPAQPRNRRIVQVDGIERGKYAAAMLVGYHSRAGTPGGLLSHTWVGRLIHEIRIQGRPAGEALLNAYLFGHYGVPVVFACGADDFVKEVRADLGDDLATATVKETLGPTACIALPPARSHAIIRAAAEKGMREDRSRAPLVAEPPIVIEVEFHTAAMSVQGAEVGGEVVGPRTLRFSAGDVPETVAAVWRSLTHALKDDAAFLK